MTRPCKLYCDLLGWSLALISLSGVVSAQETPSGKRLDYEQAKAYWTHIRQDSCTPIGRLAKTLSTSKDRSLKIKSAQEILAFPEKEAKALEPFLLYTIGYNHKELLAFETAEALFTDLLDMAETEPLPVYHTKALNLLGGIRFAQHDYDGAIAYYQASKDVALGPDDRFYATLNLFLTYRNVGDTQAALGYLEDCKAIYATDPQVFDRNLLIYLNVHQEGLTTNSAVQDSLYKQALHLALTSEDVQGQLRVRYALGNHLMALDRTEEAISQYGALLDQARAIGYKWYEQTAHYMLASQFLKKNAYDQALTHLDRAGGDQGFRNRPELRHASDSLYAVLFAGKRDFERALAYTQRSNRYLDSLRLVEKENAYIEAGIKFGAEKKAQENELLKKDLQIKALTVREKQVQNIIAWGVGALLFVTGLYFIARFQRKKKVAAQLRAKNRTILGQNAVLERHLGEISDLNEELQQANATKSKLFGILAHDLLNPFNALFGYTQMLKHRYGDLNVQERSDYIDAIYRASQNNFQLTNQLLDWAKLQQNLIHLNNERIGLQKLVDESLEVVTMQARLKQLVIEPFIRSEQTVYTDYQMLRTIVINLLTNAIKFSNKESRITLRIGNHQGNLLIIVRDYGIGIPAAHLEAGELRIGKDSRKGTQGEMGNALGLTLCRDFAKLLQGSLHFKSGTLQGTRVTLSIPDGLSELERRTPSNSEQDVETKLYRLSS